MLFAGLAVTAYDPSECLEESRTACFETEALTAICLLEEALRLLGPYDHFLDLGDLPLCDYVPPAEGGQAVTETVKKMLDLVDAKARPLGNPYDSQVLQDSGFIATPSPDPLGAGEQANLFVITQCGGSHAGPASHLADRHASHGEPLS